jgi:hypothetical protein
MRERCRKIRGVEIAFVVGLLLAGLLAAVYLLRMPAPDGMGPATGSAAAR